MFTGIIQRVGKVVATDSRNSSLGLKVQTGFERLELGESIAVNGVCLTVAEFTGDTAYFFASSETLARTNLDAITEGSRVNLERALCATDRLSGHIVQGHVDGKGKLIHVAVLNEPESESAYEAYIRIPENLARYCVEKGSIAINGVSLTINSIDENPEGSGVTLGFVLVPHTWSHTSFSSLAQDDAVNIEVDVLAKYVERLSRPHLSSSREPSQWN